MHNVQMQLADDTLLICVGLKPAFEPARTEIIASTMSDKAVAGRPDLRVALVVYSKGPAEQDLALTRERIRERIRARMPQGPGK